MRLHNPTHRPVDTIESTDLVQASFALRNCEAGDAQRITERYERISDAGIVLDNYQLVSTPWKQQRDELSQRISTDLLDIHHRITEAIHSGLHVLYVPGSFDLVHAGHASYILEAVEMYLDLHKGLSEDDVYVVALCDEEDLIKAVKPAHIYALGGDHPRPFNVMSCLSMSYQIHDCWTLQL